MTSSPPAAAARADLNAAVSSLLPSPNAPNHLTLMAPACSWRRRHRPAVPLEGSLLPPSPMTPPLVYAPLPVEWSRLNVVGPVTVADHAPFAAVFPWTPPMTTR